MVNFKVYTVSRSLPQELFPQPLAYLLRPRRLEEFFGQEDVVGEGKLLRKLIEQDQLHSIILFGPPGSGKTTLAGIVAQQTNAEFETLSAVTSGVADLRKVVERAAEHKRLGGKTVVFVDEIHRFNKAQQDALLPHVENGTIILIGATTENPSFEVNSALLSRSKVFVLKALDKDALGKVLDRAWQKASDYLQKPLPQLSPEAKSFLLDVANGDARQLLNDVQLVITFSPQNEQTLSLEHVQMVLQQKHLRYDKSGEEHYNIISALHKSMRDSDPDGALYWLGRMLEAGEDPLYVARRLIRFASEDVGMADPQALLVAVAAQQACHFVGMPECTVNLAQAVVHLSLAPKSNALYEGYNLVKQDIQRFGNLEVPLHIRNAPTKLMKEWGYGKGYKYAHDDKNAKVDQEHLPPQLKGRKYYNPKKT